MLRTDPHLSWLDVDGDLVLFDTRTGGYHHLNASASAIWRELAKGTEPKDIVGLLAGRHGIAESEIDATVTAFIEQAVQLQLLTTRE